MPPERPLSAAHAWSMHLWWPALALALLLAFNFAFTPGFAQVELRDGRFYGVLIDILNHGAKVMLLALGMTLVIATGGVDLSVGAVMALGAAVAAVLVNHPDVPFSAAIAVALGVALLAGAWNGVLVAWLNMQPIVATLILMVAGRGIAQLITDGQIVTFTDARLSWLGSGAIVGLPAPIVLVAGAWACLATLARLTALGLFVEAVGDNPRAARCAGIGPRPVRLAAYALCGLCAGAAGLVAAGNIRCADANNLGLTLELDAIMAVVIGGTALTGGRLHLGGSLIGAALIQTLTTTMYMRNVSADVATVPKALVILAVALLQSPVMRARLRRIVAGARTAP
ncbi:MAG: ABC transporter permease [Phycisphaerae bacterium]|nr:ABC transporter permease [Phycisphaerae bacterium]MCZ2401136.1 ABC transporter permease [Phycisphaerae bacterium]